MESKLFTFHTILANIFYNMDSTSQLVHQIRQLDHKFHKACQQVKILNINITCLKQRYQRAIGEESEDHRDFCSSVRRRIASYEGVRKMMYEYASHKCKEIEKLQGQVLQLVESDDETDSDDQSDSDGQC